MTGRESSPPSLRSALAEQAARSATRDPVSFRTVQAAVERIRTAGAAPGLPVGARAPAFALPDARGRLVRLDRRLLVGPVVVAFYRGAWCPYCNLTLRALQQALPSIRASGASLIAISPQRPDDSLALVERERWDFDVLSDVEQVAIRGFRVQFRVPSDVQEVHLDAYDKDISRLNADGSWNLPVPATFVLDRSGTVRARHVDPDYTRRMDPAEVLDVLDALARGDD